MQRTAEKYIELKEIKIDDRISSEEQEELIQKLDELLTKLNRGSFNIFKAMKNNFTARPVFGCFAPLMALTAYVGMGISWKMYSDNLHEYNREYGPLHDNLYNGKCSRNGTSYNFTDCNDIPFNTTIETVCANLVNIACDYEAKADSGLGGGVFSTLFAATFTTMSWMGTCVYINYSMPVSDLLNKQELEFLKKYDIDPDEHWEAVVQKILAFKSSFDFRGTLPERACKITMDYLAPFPKQEQLFEVERTVNEEKIFSADVIAKKLFKTAERFTAVQKDFEQEKTAQFIEYDAAVAYAKKSVELSATAKVYQELLKDCSGRSKQEKQKIKKSIGLAEAITREAQWLYGDVGRKIDNQGATWQNRDAVNYLKYSQMKLG